MSLWDGRYRLMTRPARYPRLVQCLALAARLPALLETTQAERSKYVKAQWTTRANSPQSVLLITQPISFPRSFRQLAHSYISGTGLQTRWQMRVHAPYLQELQQCCGYP